MASFFRNRRVLVTGGAGFIGTNLLLKLLETGAIITSTVHVKSPQIKNSNIRYLKGDLCNQNFCKKAAKGQDFVFMCAANTSGANVIEKTPLVHVTPNVIMNTLMLEAAYEARVKKFLFLSSNAVYPPLNHPVKEVEMMVGEPYVKYFPVAWMKRFSEILCEIYATRIKNPMVTIVIRPANVYGPYDDFEWETSHVVPALVRKVVERHKPLEVWGDGGEIKDLMYVKDLIDALVTAVVKLEDFVQINIGSGEGVSIKRVLNTILELEKYEDAKIVFNKSKPAMIRKRILDVSLAKKLLGFEAKTNLNDGLGETIYWYKTVSRRMIKEAS